MKYLFVAAFMGIMLISSCKCNNDANKEQGDMADSMAMETNTNAMNNNNNGSTANMSDADFVKMYNLDNYTEDQVKDYRKMHDDMDWGNVPGYYPEASTRVLTQSDIKYLTEWGHAVMLNEIYARHGMKFTDNENIKEHFEEQGWYTGNKDNVDDLLTDIEKQNIEFLKNNPSKHISPNV